MFFHYYTDVCTHLNLSVKFKAEGKKLGNPNLKADNLKRIEKANAFAENLRGTITSFVKDGYTQRQIVDELSQSVSGHKEGTYFS